MAAVTGLVVWQLYPSLLFRDTTPAFGDLAGHMPEPGLLRERLFNHFRVSGWSQDSFTGYPSLTFYFPLAGLLTVVADLVLPYNVAFKLVAASGPVALPWCAYAFGRLNRCNRLTSATFGVSVLALLLQPTLFLPGGSIESTAGGEYSYTMAMALGLLVLGLARAGHRTGRHRVVTAGLLATTVLLHILPALVVVIGFVISAVLRPAWAKARWTATVLAAAGLVTGFWAMPFLLRAPFTAGPAYPKAGPVATWLFPEAMAPVAVLACIGILAAFLRNALERDDTGVFLFLMAVVSAVAFAVTPTGRVWNARFLSIWLLWLCLLAAYGLVGLADLADEVRRRRARGRALGLSSPARLALPAVFFVAVLPMWDTRIGGGLLTRTWPDKGEEARLYYGGYERNPHRAEYQGLIDTVRTVAREHGCGRAHVEYNQDVWTDLRLAVQRLLPYWTDGCIGVTLGLYTQASATSPYVDLTNSRLAADPVVLTQHLRRDFDIAAGVADLRVLGVRYFVASREKTREAADTSPELRPVGQTEPVHGRFWKFYEIADVRIVEPLPHLPVVVPGIGGSRQRWETAATRWYDSGDARDVVVAADGPETWPRRSRVTENLPRRPTAATTVTDVRIDDDRVSFRVSRTGVPVLVRVSYFPNWQAHGADGPWRVTPNQMVVVPTSKTVTLRYGRTLVDHTGWLATLAGLGGLVFLGRTGPVDMPEPVEPTPHRQPARPPAPSPRKKRRR